MTTSSRRKLLLGSLFCSLPITARAREKEEPQSFIVSKYTGKPQDVPLWTQPHIAGFTGTLEDALKHFIIAGILTEAQANDFLLATRTKDEPERMTIKDGDHFYMAFTRGEYDKTEYLEARVSAWDIQTSREALVYRIPGSPNWLVQPLACHNWSIYYPPVWAPPVWSEYPPTVMGPQPYTVYREAPPDTIAGIVPQAFVPSSQEYIRQRRAENRQGPPVIAGRQKPAVEVVTTPEPGTLGLLCVGLAGLWRLRARRSRSS